MFGPGLAAKPATLVRLDCAWIHGELKRSMRRRHFAGEKLLVDYAGRTVPILGYGGAEATRTETLPDWLGSQVRALEFYGAAPTIIVPDNPKAGVTRADRSEPELQ